MFSSGVTPYLSNRFVHGMKTPNVRRVSIRGNHFVLTNSMALEGDGCFICRPVEDALNEIASKLFQQLTLIIINEELIFYLF